MKPIRGNDTDRELCHGASPPGDRRRRATTRTLAERGLGPKAHLGMTKELLVPGPVVFIAPAGISVTSVGVKVRFCSKYPVVREACAVEAKRPHE